MVLARTDGKTGASLQPVLTLRKLQSTGREDPASDLRPTLSAPAQAGSLGLESRCRCSGMLGFVGRNVIDRTPDRKLDIELTYDPASAPSRRLVHQWDHDEG
jgi:hypothetical protein